MNARGTIEANVTRDEAIRRGRAEGRTLESLARRFGVTRERIRQITLKEAIVPIPAADRLAPTATYTTLIDRLGWEQEGGRADGGGYFVRIWNDTDERIFTASRYRDLPNLYAQAAAYAANER